jgi:DNA-binding GntR family transcriptional regulator
MQTRMQRGDEVVTDKEYVRFAGSKETMVDRVRREVLALISRLGLKPGDRLNTESELAELCGVSRSTVREALKLLEQQGIVNAVQGQGRFISASGSLRVDRPMTKYESITQVLAGRGYSVSSAVLSVEESEASNEEADALEVEPGTPVVRLLRIRYGDDRPLVVSANTVLRESLPGPVEYRDWSGSLTAALEAHGHQVNSSLATISAVELPAEMESRYNLVGLGPWLRVNEVCLDRSGQRVLYSIDYHRGDEISFSVLRRR